MADGFSPLVNVDGTPLADGVFEQAAGLVCVYSGRRQLALDLIGLCGGGVLVAYFYNPKGNLPSLALVQQGSTWFLWVAGTVNLKQWTGNVIGAMLYKNLGGGVKVNSYFNSMAQRLWTLGQSYLPDPDPELRFVIVGHSLGGAVAQILALQVVQRYSAGQVKLITFGQPKAYGVGAEAYNPFAYYSRFRLGDDPVPQVPLDEGQNWWGALSSAIWVASDQVAWRHYGMGWLIDENGKIGSDPGLDYLQQYPFQWVANMAVNDHLMKTVVAALETGLGVQ